MTRGKNGTYRFQNKKGGLLETLKNRWADNDFSPIWFYSIYFRKYSCMTHDEFLELINYHGIISDDLLLAIEDFWKVSI